MKKLIVIALLMLTASSASALISVHLGFSFHGDLSTHGRWVWMGDVGQVWVPRVHVSWTPYSYGHWAWSHWGWMWVSHEPWHVTYHYGRWLWTDYHGWVWVPGRVWAPAWVVWSYGPGWVGWAPMPPDWRRGYWNRPYYHRHHGRWVVVSDRGFLSPTVWKEKLPEYRVKNIVNESFDTKFKGGARFSGPPERDYVEKKTGVSAEHIGRERVKTIERDRITSLQGRDQRDKTDESTVRGKTVESTRTREGLQEGRTIRERDARYETSPEGDTSRRTTREPRDSRERSDPTLERESRTSERRIAPERRESSRETPSRTYDGSSRQRRDNNRQRTESPRTSSHETRSYYGGRRGQSESSHVDRDHSHGSSGSRSGGSRSRGTSDGRRK